MKRPLTLLSYAMIISGITIAFLGYSIPGAIFCSVAYIMALAEVMVISGTFQVTCAVLSNLGLGICLDTMHNGFPLFTIALPTICGTSSTRLLIFNKIGYIKASWYEPLSYAIGLALYITANIQSQVGWAGWALPIPPLFMGSWTLVGKYTTLRDFKRAAQCDLCANPEQPAPDFSLQDEEGNTVSLSDYKSKRHLLLLFVRGDWCPTCHIMLRTYEKNREKFQEKNVLLMAIGPDPIGVNKQMVVKLGLEYKILADEKQEIAQKYGIQMQEPHSAAKYETGVPLPASFLIDKNGIVKFTSRADRMGDFMNPDKIFESIATLN